MSLVLLKQADQTFLLRAHGFGSNPIKLYLHLQNCWGDYGGLIGVNPVDHIALDARREGEDTVEEYDRWSVFLIDPKLKRNGIMRCNFIPLIPKNFFKYLLLIL